LPAEFRYKESWMIPKKNNTGSGQPGQAKQDLAWSDLEALARRVIRAANLAVMAHAELDAFTHPSTSASNSGKRAG